MADARQRLIAALASTDDRPVRGLIVGSMIVGMVLSGVSLAYKVAEFMFTLTTGEFAGTFDVQIVVYFTIALGWLLLLIWCLISGKFQEMEKHKADMLVEEEEYERRGI